MMMEHNVQHLSSFPPAEEQIIKESSDSSDSLKASVKESIEAVNRESSTVQLKQLDQALSLMRNR